ncbi:carbonic anhydrase [Paraburkholderia caballeronis]|uniref:carbonic anhydrase n=1 Tax=Paraburkholderia caballeronis TaxID=416943 RepID=UPI001066A000|nr:carbonic anhydrase family protein [Paraburkholderia caballeronis]TDV11794.1 carbonic anhydrase [Paraburkholderia caballeronis]TDV14875.1 carbonic anhydrase [Paraburkholderia caballeronis]TDV23995.1 carbonic anhydrase [Paraburkholderia caballeronis]
MNPLVLHANVRRAACIAVAATAAWSSYPACANPASVASAPHAESFDYDHQKAWHIESGHSQSPIAIRSADVVNAARASDENDRIAVHVGQTGATVTDNGHTVQVVPAGGSATIRGRHFDLVQAHFHAPSEHTIDGERYPLEGHFVFRAQDGRLAVVAVLYREGAENAQFATIVRAAKRDVQTPIAQFDVAKLMPGDIDAYYHYLGSLTTPPLNENVEWYVLSEPVDVSRDDVAAFTRLYAHNARNTQPLDGRPLLRYSR